MAKKPAKKAPKADKKIEPAPEAVGEDQQPQLSIITQYIKDLSFENPNSPNSLLPKEKQPEINININVNANPLSETDFEVILKLEAKAGIGKEMMFNVDLTYAGIFRIVNLPPEAMSPAILIECPRLLFPFARQIISDATRNGGFPPLMIDPVDFARLYQQRMAEAAAAEEASATAKTSN